MAFSAILDLPAPLVTVMHSSRQFSAISLTSLQFLLSDLLPGNWHLILNHDDSGSSNQIGCVRLHSVLSAFNSKHYSIHWVFVYPRIVVWIVRPLHRLADIARHASRQGSHLHHSGRHSRRYRLRCDRCNHSRSRLRNFRSFIGIRFLDFR